MSFSALDLADTARGPRITSRTILTVRPQIVKTRLRQGERAPQRGKSQAASRFGTAHELAVEHAFPVPVPSPRLICVLSVPVCLRRPSICSQPSPRHRLDTSRLSSADSHNASLA